MGQTTGGNPIQNAGNIVKIREIAKMRGLKLNFISQQIGKSNGYLSEISGRNANVPSKYLPAIAEILGTSVEYINGLVDDIDDGLTTSPLDVDYGSFQFDRFYALCQKSGKTQAHLYKMVGMPDKAGSNLRRTKNVKSEILEVWAKELHTTAAYLNGETDDSSPVPAPAAPEQKEKPNALDGIELEKLSPARRALLEALDGMTEENIMKLVRIAQAVKMELPE